MIPHPLTIASIELSGLDAHIARTVRYRCGCDYLTSRAAWVLCRYHEGYDGGVEAAQRDGDQ